MDISKPTVAGTTCDDSPTVTFWYKDIGSDTWKSFDDDAPLDHAKSVSADTPSAAEDRVVFTS